MYVLKIVVAGLALAASHSHVPEKHVSVTFRIPFESQMPCVTAMKQLYDQREPLIALAAHRLPMKPQTFETSCEATGTTRA